jgi:hypothetical protein
MTDQTEYSWFIKNLCIQQPSFIVSMNRMLNSVDIRSDFNNFLDMAELVDKAKVEKVEIFKEKVAGVYEYICRFDLGHVGYGRGSSVAEAVQKAVRDYIEKQEKWWVEPRLYDFIHQAIELYNGVDKQMFTAGALESILVRHGYKVNCNEIVEKLENNPRLVQLCSGQHFIVLPIGYNRFQV